MNIRFCLSISVLLLATPVLRAQLPANWPADYPAWWYHPADPASGVIDATAPHLNQDNAALLNQGQLWNLAEHGIAELDRSLAPLGGAGFTLEALRDPSKSPAYLSPALIGQLKQVSSKFFDRFAEVGFSPDSSGWPAGLSLDPVTGYPWPQNQTPANLAPANLGQAKHLFAWEAASWIAAVMTIDSDSDGLPDFWERYYFGGLEMNGTDDSDGDGLSDNLEWLVGSDPTGTESDLPILQPIHRGTGDLVIQLHGAGFYRVDENSNRSILKPL